MRFEASPKLERCPDWQSPVDIGDFMLPVGTMYHVGVRGMGVGTQDRVRKRIHMMSCCIVFCLIVSDHTVSFDIIYHLDI